MRPTALYLFSILFLFIIQGTSAQTRETKRLIKEIKRVIKSKSLVSENMNWTKLNKDIKSIAYTNSHDTDKEQVYTVFTNSLKQAGDKHSLFLSERVSSQIRSHQSESIYGTSTYLEANIGYLKIPSCITFDYQKDLKFADTIISQIKKLDHNTIKKWIIDLRDNNGGNVWPMLAGLTPITGDGLINYSIRNGKAKANYIKQGTVANSNISTVIYNTKQKFEKLAVIVNHQTASSGEMLAISLLGFEKTKSFGYKTRGLTTTNSTFHFNDGTMLFLATGFMADRNKKKYSDGITPDLIFENDISDGDLIKKVIEWLNE